MRAAVHRAVEELLVEEAGDALTIPAVAARAGVHATTLYRRWGSVGELLADVATSRFSGEIVVPDTGSLRGDLQRWAADVATDLADPDVLALMRAAIGAGGEQGACACRGRPGGPVGSHDRAGAGAGERGADRRADRRRTPRPALLPGRLHRTRRYVRLGARTRRPPAAAAVVEAERTTGFRVAEPSYTFE